MFEIGFMQGRSGPKYKGHYQAHPVDNWAHEFFFASQNDFSSIEFIVDLDDYNLNPLFSDTGVNILNNIIDETGVSVRSICADCFMDLPLHSDDSKNKRLANELLSDLLEAAKKINVEVIVIPCVDRSALSSSREKDVLVSELINRTEELKKLNISLSLETDLPADEFGQLMQRLPNVIGVNYDIGNSASLGYNLLDEFNSYGNRINDIHIKDRLIDGGPVFLGTGNADLKNALISIKELNFNGPIIMQTFRDENGAQILLDQKDYLRKIGW